MKRNELIKELVKINKIKVRQRDQDICQRCGRKTYGWQGQCSHVLPLSAIGQTSLAFDMNNMKVLCWICHTNWHSDEAKGMEWFRDMFPDRYEYLVSKLADRESIRLSLGQLEELYDRLK